MPKFGLDWGFKGTTVVFRVKATNSDFVQSTTASTCNMSCLARKQPFNCNRYFWRRDGRTFCYWSCWWLSWFFFLRLQKSFSFDGHALEKTRGANFHHEKSAFRKPFLRENEITDLPGLQLLRKFKSVRKVNEEILQKKVSRGNLLSVAVGLLPNFYSQSVSVSQGTKRNKR